MPSAGPPVAPASSVTRPAPASGIVIAGAGPVGSTLALALAQGGVRCTLIETADTSPAPGGLRPLALSEGSRRILDTLGVWAAIRSESTPIRKIHVSQRGRFGVTRMSAGDYGLDALGQVVQAHPLTGVLDAAVGGHPLIDVRRPARISGGARSPRPGDTHLTLTIANAKSASKECEVAPAGPGTVEQVHAQLLVAANGGRSALRTEMGIDVRERDYRQVAVTAVVEVERDHGNVAYERFTESGPIAVLPMAGRACALVWTLPAADAEPVQAMDARRFLKRLASRFGGRLGRFLRLHERTCFPLHLIQAKSLWRSRGLVIGGAARTLHPVAGQGLNLGLRDAASLADVIIDAVREGLDPGSDQTLEGYARSRHRDHLLTTALTDLLATGFVAGLAPVATARGLAMVALDLSPRVKRVFAGAAMGLAGRQPRLVRGLVP